MALAWGQLGAIEIGYRSLLGRRVRTTPDALIRSLLTTRFVLFCALASLIFFWADIHSLSNMLPYYTRLIYWAIATYLTVVVYVGATILWGLAAFRWKIPTPHLSVIPAIVLMPIIYFNRGWLHLLTGFPMIEMKQLITAYLQDLFGVWMLETLYIEFVEPILTARYRIRNRPAQTSPDEQGNMVVRFGDEKIDLKSVIYAKSADHYIEIIFSDRPTLTLYGRMADFISIASIGDGMSPHRSYWVSKSAVRSVGKSDRKHFIILNDSTRIPISEAKRKSVQEWLSEEA